MNTLSKDWVTTEVIMDTPRGQYWVFRLAEGWQAKLRPSGVPEGARHVDIDTLGQDGYAELWPTLGTAQVACQAHLERMVRFGESADVAAAWVMKNTDLVDFRQAG